MADEFARAPLSYVDEIPCFLPAFPPDKYNDAPDLEVYLARYAERLQRKQICQTLLLSNLPARSRVLSAAEGTGEVVLSLATKYPDIRFYAFDITVNRERIARRLADRVGVQNVTFYIGSVEDVPFSDAFFRGVIERGIFHALPSDVKKRNLAEIERTCRGTVVMNWMTRNATWYIVRQWFRSLLFRDRTIWKDSISTYRNIPKKYNTLKKLARLIEAQTGHSVRLLRSFAGDQELEEVGSDFLAFVEPLGGLVYATDD